MKALFVTCLLATTCWFAAPTTAEELELFTAPSSSSEVAPASCTQPELFPPAAEERIVRPNPQWCGDPCTTAGAESYCTGYACQGGVLRRDSCTCLQSGWGGLRWACGWAC